MYVRTLPSLVSLHANLSWSHTLYVLQEFHFACYALSLFALIKTLRSFSSKIYTCSFCLITRTNITKRIHLHVFLDIFVFLPFLAIVTSSHRKVSIYQNGGTRISTRLRRSRLVFFFARNIVGRSDHFRAKVWENEQVIRRSAAFTWIKRLSFSRRFGV